MTQAGAGCSVALSATSMSASPAGGNGFSNITAGACCPWSAASNDSWITVTSAPSVLTTAACCSRSPRPQRLCAHRYADHCVADLTVSHRSACTYTLIPEPVDDCQRRQQLDGGAHAKRLHVDCGHQLIYTLTPTTRTMPAAGGTGTFTVGTASGCVWAATTTAPVAPGELRIVAIGGN